MAGYVEIYIDKGTDYNLFINLSDDTTGLPINISGYSIQSKIRKSYYSVNASATFSTNIVDAANGNVSLSLTSSQTSNLKPGRYVYDVISINPSNVTSRVIEGIASVFGDVTR